MSKEEIRIVALPPMRVLCFRGFSATPEIDAFSKLQEWAKHTGLLEGKYDFRVFGFNNPDPTPGSPNYGYDVWLMMGLEVEGDDEVKVIDFPGGLYGVLRVKGISSIGAGWKALVDWREQSKYKQAHHQWLEESFPPLAPNVGEDEIELDLMIPISE